MALAEERHLHRGLARTRPLRLKEALGPSRAAALQIQQDFARAVDHRAGQPGQPRHMHAVRAVGPAGNDAVQEYHVVAAPLRRAALAVIHGHVVVDYMWESFG